MNKQEFLAELRNRLEGAPKDEIEEQIEFYGEMIDDRIEEGMTEEQAILQLGPMDDIVSCVLSEIPFAEIAKDRLRPKRPMKAWEIVILIVGAPVWLPLLIALFAIVFSLYVSLWTVIISFWSVFVSLGACAVGLVVSSVALAWGGNDLLGLAVLGAGLACAGLCIFSFFGCDAATKGTVWLTKKVILSIKKRLLGKGRAR